MEIKIVRDNAKSCEGSPVAAADLVVTFNLTHRYRKISIFESVYWMQ